MKRGCLTRLAAGGMLALLLAGCGGQTLVDPTPRPISAKDVIATVKPDAAGKPGEAGAGAQLFQAQGCAGCHQIKGQGGAVGPALSDIGTVGATRKPGMDAQAYIRESIVQPNAFVVEGFQPGIMPQTYDQALSDEQLDALVNYLLEQK